MSKKGTTTMKKPLQEWISEQVVGDEMLWKGAFGGQMEDLRGIERMMGAGLDYEDYKDKVAFVISTHRSKSITLPVVLFDRSDIGLVVVVRENFYNWKLSVMSEKPIDDDLFPYLFFTTPPVEPDYTGNPLASCYFEGFPREYIFGYHSENQKAWSAEFGGLSTIKHVLFLCLKAIGHVKPLAWKTRESHRAELEAADARDKARREAQRSTS